jgi:hypothetical protein
LSTPKDHHYVPKSFFKPWANQVQEVIVYERKNGIILRPYRQFTKSICVQSGLYSYTDDVEETRRNALEQRLFSIVDTDGASVLRKLQSVDGAVRLSVNDRYSFAIFINSLRIRTPESIKYNSQNAEDVLREALKRNDPKLEEKEIKEQLDGLTLLEWTEKTQPALLKNKGRELIGQFILGKQFVSRIHNMSWLIVKKVSSGTNLLSSDRPLVLIGKQSDDNLGFALSISPNRIFLASSKPESLEHFLARSPTDAIRHMNALTIQQAKNKAFSNNRNHALRFFQNRLGKHHGILPWASID